MTNLLKRAAAGVLALAMCVGLSGCYSENKTWAARLGDDTLPIGGYIYYLSSAYSEGAGKVDTSTEVLKADIEGKTGSDWVTDKAMDYLYSYYYVNQKFDELGLTLDEADQESINNATSSMWTYFKGEFEAMGIAESSFKLAYSTYNTKLSKLMQAMYGKGGELELSEDELRSYYTENYVYYQYFYADLSTTDEEGNPVDMDDDEKAEVKTYLTDQADLVSRGRIDLEAAADNYASLHNIDSTISDPVAYQHDNLSSVFSDTLESLDNGKAGVADATSRYYVVQKLDIEEDFQALLEDETRFSRLINELKLEEFAAYAAEQGKGLGIQLNEDALKDISPARAIGSMSKNGTASAEDSSAAG